MMLLPLLRDTIELAKKLGRDVIELSDVTLVAG